MTGSDLQMLTGWLSAQAPVVLAAAAVTARRLIAAAVLAGGVGGAFGGAMRRSSRVAEALTPWLLATLALPWLPVVAGLSLAGYLTEPLVLAAAALTAAPPVAEAVGSSYLARARAESLRAALRRILVTILLAEILGLNSGLGAQIRLHFLFWNPALLGAGVVAAASVWGIGELMAAVVIGLRRGRHRALG